MVVLWIIDGVVVVVVVVFGDGGWGRRWWRSFGDMAFFQWSRHRKDDGSMFFLYLGMVSEVKFWGDFF